MARALSMGMIRPRESEFGRASSGPTSLRHRATGSKRPRQTRARPGKQTGCRTSHEFADRWKFGDRRNVHPASVRAKPLSRAVEGHTPNCEEMVYSWRMGRTNIEMDETLVRKARKLTGLTTKREIVER